ncbi:MAG: DsbA family protein [Rhodospirillales bacterium]
MSYMWISRRGLMGAAAALALAPAAFAQNSPAALEAPDATQVTASDHVMGKADAPVTVIEYASMTCPHCAVFHGTVLPKIKSEYVDAGKVRVVFRDFPLDRLALTASVIARCAEPERYLSFVDVLFSSQLSWARSENPLDALKKVAALGGVGEAKADACLKDESLFNAVLSQRLGGERTFKINATPALIVNGKPIPGGADYETLKKAIEAQLPKS